MRGGLPRGRGTETGGVVLNSLFQDDGFADETVVGVGDSGTGGTGEDAAAAVGGAGADAAVAGVGGDGGAADEVTGGVAAGDADLAEERVTGGDGVVAAGGAGGAGEDAGVDGVVESEGAVGTWYASSNAGRSVDRSSGLRRCMDSWS